MTRKFTLSPTERLKSRKQIARIFSDGQSQFCYPFKLAYILETTETEPQLQFGVTVPTKKVKTAVTRNRIKRLSREAYRINKLPLQDALSKSKSKLSLMFIYIDGEAKNFAVIEKSILTHIEKLIRKISAGPRPSSG